MEFKTVSLADRVYERLENDILTGKYKRGEVLTEARLSQELEVSRTPIREALRRLLQERLITEDGRGTVVLGITLKDYEDMSAVRIRLEGLAVRGFIENKTEESIRELKDAVEIQEFYLSKQDAEHMKQSDSVFHQTIYRYCGSTILEDILLPLHNKVQRFRKISFSQHNRAEESSAEHRRIYEAIAAGDAEKAEQLMIEHVGNAIQYIMDRGI